MKNALMTTSRFAVLGLLVAGLSGCGTQNPMSPVTTDMAATPTVSTDGSSTPFMEEPENTETGTWISDPSQDPQTRERKAKKPKREDHPGRGVGPFSMDL